MCNQGRTCMERSQHLHNTERMRKLKILRQKIVAPKKNKMNAGNLGFSQNMGMSELCFTSVRLILVQNLSRFNGLSLKQFISLVAYSWEYYNFIKTVVVYLKFYNTIQRQLQDNDTCISQIYVSNPETFYIIWSESKVYHSTVHPSSSYL